MRPSPIVALLGLLTTSLAHNIQMGAHQRECFHEALHRDDKMTVTFQVGDREFGGAGNLEIDFWVSALLSRAWSSPRQSFAWHSKLLALRLHLLRRLYALFFHSLSQR